MSLFKPLAGIVIVLSLVFTQGCVVARGTIGEPLQEDSISAIKKGTTNMAEVVSLIGAPDRIVRGNDRDIFHYLSSNSKCNTTGPDGLRCCHANEILQTHECRRT